MRAAVWYGAGDVRVEDVPEAPPGPGEVTIDVAYCGICGSDLHEYADGPHAIPVGEPHPESGVAAPLVLGHEFCGTVRAAGAGVTGLAPGDRVAVEPHYRCGSCPRCRAGEYNICRHFGFAGLMGHGGLAERATVPAYMLHRLPDAVSLEQAAVFEPAAVALHAVRRAGIRPGESVAVLGLGPIGLLVTRLAARCGAGRIVAADRSPARRELALRMGAAATGADLAEVTEGEGVDVAFEAAGSPDTLRACLAATRRGGRVMLLGLTGTITLDAFALVNNEQTIMTSVGYRDAYPELTRMVAEEGVDLAGIVTSTIPLDHVVRDGFDALLRGEEQVKVLVRPTGRRP
ncbi:Threonine dehydrogenase and related Zn-dependent dehydrogenases [[Actinomadura] parvosata subsp. kistnae]|uniref:Butanediol dehydrogenase n=1 Tax=[Actinomadura] parvosata subsp. kistnae TaxID=1909395 RepID=A0A1V0A4K3_9ACTN|nr:2,3-butanediol dehydrogenase [Nonomuraea sp. ATCC 55076]AQZ65140.1 butanediol dehydrogenase [Nonomuraea sp. ATCC 55076]SPL96427.1 Threonine dehydrogenase and related Zn-dependent dehydrogenases [Actinomadura parvosata subsp. kistnae]